MQKKDKIVIGVCAVVGISLLLPPVLKGFIRLTSDMPLVMSFLKFALLATFGECLALRITTGDYNRPGFGILPKAIVWGFLGMLISVAFTIFGAGVPRLLNVLGILGPDASSFDSRFFTALGISVLLNSLFAPLLMVTHKLSDLHIAARRGSLGALLVKPDMAELLAAVDWKVMWGFVLKKTIPLFWIPAHTITFLLPGHFRVLFAALLGVALGVILAFANLRSHKA
ncbi:MAG: Mpv17/PMP22 family protein [Desulfovibrio sp.]|nr:Mpv17/PMP22 family protein [Desulfovibrio sp.]